MATVKNLINYLSKLPEDTEIKIIQYKEPTNEYFPEDPSYEYDSLDINDISQIVYIKKINGNSYLKIGKMY